MSYNLNNVEDLLGGYVMEDEEIYCSYCGAEGLFNIEEETGRVYCMVCKHYAEER